MIIYLAAPFFNPEQMATVFAVESAIERAGHELITPRKRGPTLKDLSPEDRKMAAAKVFSTNCLDIERCEAVCAVIDDRDPGTIWEMGYAYRASKKIYSYTAHDYGVNVMLQGCILGHAKGVAELAEMMHRIKVGASLEKFKLEAAT
jgi:nucleoside 2-deoxyribosyltransferase